MFVAAEQSGGTILTNLNFSVQDVCASCLQLITPPKKTLRCSVCKAALYCSEEVCNKESHLHLLKNANMICPVSKARLERTISQGDPVLILFRLLNSSQLQGDMERLLQMQALTRSFPCGWLKADGAFIRHRARTLRRAGRGRK